MKTEFYRMEYEAWDEGTDSLTLEQEAAYLRLCHQMYRRRGAIPDTPATLARIWRCHPNKARKLLDDLLASGKVTRTPDGLTNNRVRQELDHRGIISRHKADAGHTGGIRSGEVRRKPLKSHDPPEAGASSTSLRAEQRREEQSSSVDPPDQGDGHQRAEYDRLEAALRSAAGLTNDPAPALHDLSPILGLMDRGFDLERHVLPAIRAKAKAGKRGRSWSWYVGAIEEFGSSRARASSGKPPTATASALGETDREAGLRGLVRRWLEHPTTWPPKMGPPPNRPGCVVPAEILAELGVKVAA